VKKTEYYELVKKSYEVHPEQLVTAAVRSCSLCNTMIDGMGGPGWGSICLPCGDDILHRRIVYDRKREVKND